MIFCLIYVKFNIDLLFVNIFVLYNYRYKTSQHDRLIQIPFLIKFSEMRTRSVTVRTTEITLYAHLTEGDSSVSQPTSYTNPHIFKKNHLYMLCHCQNPGL